MSCETRNVTMKLGFRIYPVWVCFTDVVNKPVERREMKTYNDFSTRNIRKFYLGAIMAVRSKRSLLNVMVCVQSHSSAPWTIFFCFSLRPTNSLWVNLIDENLWKSTIVWKSAIEWKSTICVFVCLSASLNTRCLVVR